MIRIAGAAFWRVEMQQTVGDPLGLGLDEKYSGTKSSELLREYLYEERDPSLRNGLQGEQ